MTYLNKYEYDDITMLAMDNALKLFFGKQLKSVEFYKMDDPRNVIGKVDGTAYLMLRNDFDLSLQIKRSDHYPTSFSVSGNAMRSYLENNYNIKALLVGTAYQRNMKMYHWRDFIDFARENAQKWKHPDYDFYVIKLEYLKSLYFREVPYTDEDYLKMVDIWDNA